MMLLLGLPAKDILAGERRYFFDSDVEHALRSIPNVAEILKEIDGLENPNLSRWEITFQVLFPDEHVLFVEEKKGGQIELREIIAHSADMPDFLEKREKRLAELSAIGRNIPETELTTRFYQKIS